MQIHKLFFTIYIVINLQTKVNKYKVAISYVPHNKIIGNDSI